MNDSVPTLPAGRADRGLLVVAPFAAALFSGAALMFVAEPLIGKQVLPRLGGSPAVWNTCVVFYQVVLLAGYAYAHLAGTRLSFRVQAALQLGLLGLACLALPIAFPAGWPPVAGSPIPFVLLGLLVGVGAPFFVLAATSPLLQAWFARTGHRTAHDPYYLYAASNAGSVLALLAYPVLIEPSSAVPTQAAAWSIGFGLLIVLTAWCALLALRERAAQTGALPPGAGARFPRGAGALSPGASPSDAGEAIGWRRRGRWVALAAVPSSLMLGVTTYASTDIAAVPLLWTVPLALYLVSLILAFASRRLVPNRLARGLMTGLVIPLVLVLALGLNQPVSLLVPLHAGAFFVIALVLHTELADDRPSPRHLTEFYLLLAAGGALGGLCNAIIAPLVFDSIAEYPLAVVAAALLLPGLSQSKGRLALAGWLAALVAGVGTAVLLALKGAAHPTLPLLLTLLLLYLAVAVAVKAGKVKALVVCMWLASLLVPRPHRELLFADRTFFGVLRVWHDAVDRQHILVHGTTTHGAQRTGPAYRHEALGYYHASGPIGQLIAANARLLDNAQIGVVGLGAGSLAAYVRPGQHWTFYEIDPAVERVARDPRLFTFLPDCGTACDVVLGDARLSLAREPTASYRLLVLDAFSSDAIPVHLLTREAFGIYLSHLAPDGILACHISNLHLDLKPVIASAVAAHGLTAVWQNFNRSTPDHEVVPSEWVAIARTPGALSSLAVDPRWARLRPPARPEPWTDDYSNIVGVLRVLHR